MRVRRFVCAVIAGPLAIAATAGVAAACKVCDPWFHCVEQTPGAKICVESRLACSMALPCFVGGERVPDSPEAGLATFTLFGSEQPSPTALEPDAGPLALGEDARGPRAAGRGALVETMLAHGREYAVMFVDAGGGGFAIRRTEAGGVTRVEVLEVTGGHAGRSLADAMLGPRDRLVTSVTVEGRDHLLVVQATKLAGPAHATELARLRQSLSSAGRPLPPRAQPLLELRAM